VLLNGIFSIEEKFDRMPIETPIVSANHVNWFDMFYLGTLCYPIGFVAKHELKKTPFIGKIGTFIQCIFINRKDTSAREETI
jgi:1-acyl-sn-glycerol-3-phosphate acyltransferase